MKNKIKFISALLAVLIAGQSFAKDSKEVEKIKKVGKNEVIVVGRISVTPEEDMEFYAKTRGVREDEKKTDSYNVPYSMLALSDTDEYVDFLEKNPKISFEKGEFFYAVYKFDKKTRNIQFENATEYTFFGSLKTFIYIPFNYNVDVPENVKAIYIGSFYYKTTGSDFTLKNFSHVDEYELAQEALDKVTKEHYTLYRADLKENASEEKKKK